MLFYLLLEAAYYDQNLKEGRALGKRKTSLNLKLRLLARYLSLDFLLDHLSLHGRSKRDLSTWDHLTNIFSMVDFIP